MVFLGKEKKGWSLRSRMLAMALVMVENSTCSDCGNSLILSTEMGTLGHWVINEMSCLACEKADSMRRSTKMSVKRQVNFKP